MKDKNTIVKSHQLNEAYFPEHTLVDYKIFSLCLSKYNNLFDKRVAIEITAKDCVELIGANKDKIYSQLKNFKEALKKPLYIRHEDKITTTEIMPFSYIEYNNTYSYLKIKFNPDILPHIKNLKERFTMMNIKHISEFGSKYTVRLFEFMHQFKNTGYIIKSVEDLASILGYKFDSYGNFKRVALMRAINEITNTKGIKINMKEEKPHHRVTSIKLTFTLSGAKIKEKAKAKKTKPEEIITTDDIPF